MATITQTDNSTSPTKSPSLPWNGCLQKNNRSEKNTLLVANALAQVYSKPNAVDINFPKKPVPKQETTNRDHRAFPRRIGCGIVQVLQKQTDSIPDIKSAEWGLRRSTTKGILSNISKNGIAFLLNEILEEGETVQLRIFNPRLERFSIVEASVIRCTELGNDNWKIACQFTSDLTLEQLYELAHHQ